MKIKEWLFPEESEEYSMWEKIYITKKKFKAKIKRKVGIQDSENLSSHLPSSISF